MTALSPEPTFSWRPTLLALVVALLALMGLYYDTGAAMVRIWARSETFTHAFLVPPITLWLVWEKRRVLERYRPAPTLWLILPIAGLAFIWLLGEVAAVNAVTQLAFTCMLILTVPLVIGVPAARQITFPLAFLLFAVPIGEFVMPTLMDWTATVTVLALRITGIPVYQEGLHFVIPSGRWSVVEACSGVRYLIASLTVGTIFAYLNYRSTKRRLIFVGVSILVPIAANWIRAYMIVMLGHLSGNELATGADHLIYGWVFFGLVILIMFAIGMRWREDDIDLPAESFVDATARATPNSQRWTVAVVTLAVVLALPQILLWTLNSGAQLPAPRLDVMRLGGGGWTAQVGTIADWKPVYANPSVELSAIAESGDRRVGVYIAYYRQQNYQRKLISSDNVLVRSEDKSWAQVERAVRTVTIDNQAVTVRKGRLRSNVSTGERRLVAWHWYWINGRLTASDYVGKAWLAFSRLTGQGDDSAAVVIYAPEEQPGGGEAALEAYLADSGSAIGNLLVQAKGQR